MANTVNSSDADAREVAFLVAKGLTPETVAQKTNLPRAYVDQLTESETFTHTLEEVGGDVALKSWREYKSDRLAQASLRTQVKEHLDEYFAILNDIALDGRVKPEVRKDVIFKLMERAGIGKEEAEAVQTIELPPSFFASMVHATEEMERWSKKKL